MYKKYIKRLLDIIISLCSLIILSPIILNKKDLVKMRKYLNYINLEVWIIKLMRMENCYQIKRG